MCLLQATAFRHRESATKTDIYLSCSPEFLHLMFCKKLRGQLKHVPTLLIKTFSILSVLTRRLLGTVCKIMGNSCPFPAADHFTDTVLSCQSQTCGWGTLGTLNTLIWKDITSASFTPCSIPFTGCGTSSN